MERRPERLVESIFERLKVRAKGGKVPSLFQAGVSSPSAQEAPSTAHETPQGAPSPKEPLIARRYPIGLDIGARSVKWIQLGVMEGKTHLVELGLKARQEEDLRQIVAQQGLSGQAVLCLPLEEVSLRLLKLPVLPEEEMGQAIRWQIEQTLPQGVSFEEFAMDYLALPEMGGSWESSVLVAMAPRQRVTKLVEEIKAAGLTPVAVEIEPFAVAALQIRFKQQGPEETVLLVHVGASSAWISVVAKEQLVFSRTILTTDQSLTQAVVDHLRVPRQEAQTLKRAHGLLQSEEAKTVARALASPLENMVVDILHAFKSFSHQVAHAQIQRFDRVTLSGEGTQLPGLDQWLQSRMGVPVETMDPLGLFPWRDLPADVQAFRQTSSQFAVAMGLALREVPE